MLREGEGILLRLLTEVILLGIGAQEEHLPSDCMSLGRSPILPGGQQHKLWCLKYWFYNLQPILQIQAKALVATNSSLLSHLISYYQ